MKDILFLLSPGFEDAAYPGETFYCWHCALMEGILSSFPDLSDKLEVRRIAFARPRQEVVDLIGEEHQNLPVLILAEGGFVSDKDEILKALSDRHGFPVAHP